jgi:hypothetical protein
VIQFCISHELKGNVSKLQAVEMTFLQHCKEYEEQEGTESKNQDIRQDQNIETLQELHGIISQKRRQVHQIKYTMV